MKLWPLRRASKAAAPTAPPVRRRRRPPPALRRATRWTFLLALVAVAYGGIVFSRTPQGQATVAAVEARGLAATAALGLVVTDIEVQGRRTTDAATVKAALAADRGTPILAVSPTRAQQQLERLPWVRSATIERRLPGTLFVRLVEREPLAVWQHDGKLELIDRRGEVIAVSDLGRFAQLPTVVGGNDAATHATELLDMLAHEPELAARVTAAIRVDDRRWNLRIDHAIDVLLPEEEPAAAWAHLADLERNKSLLKREVQSVDLRLPDRLVLRVTASPAKEPIAKKSHPAGKNT